MNEIELGEAALEHIGVKGMKWGVRKDRPTSPSSLSKLQKLGITKKDIAVGVVTAGAATAATMMVGPLGGMTVSAASRIYSVSSTSRNSVDNIPLRKDGEYEFERKLLSNGKYSDLVPNSDYKHND